MSKADDAKLGKGYAKEHPELIGAVIQANATVEAAGILERAIEDMADAIDHEGLRYIRRAAEHRMNGEKGAMR